MRLWDINLPQLWEDDYLSLDRAMTDPGRMFDIQKFQGPADTIFDFAPPLSYALIHLALEFSTSATAARIPSLAAGLFTVLGFALLGGALFSRRAGLIAAFLCALSLFHIDFSRAIKFYSLFMCFFVFSSYFLLLALRTGKGWAYAAFAMCAADMLYSGYQGVPVFAAQALYGAACLAVWRRRPDAPPAGKQTLFLTSSLLLVLLAFSPFAPGVFFIQSFLHAGNVDILGGLSPAFFLGAVEKFLYFVYEPPRFILILALLLATAGAAAFLARKKASGLAYLALTSGFPVLAVILSQSQTRLMLSPRHLVGFFPALLLLIAVGIDACASLIESRKAQRSLRRTLLAAGLAMGLCLALVWPVLDNLEGYYVREMSQDRAFFRWLSLRKFDVTGLDFTGYKRNAKRFAAAWHAPGLFAPAGTFPAPGYRRVYLVDNFTEGATPPVRRGVPVADFGMSVFKTRVNALGLVSKAPLPMAPGQDGVYRYLTDYTGLAFYRDAAMADNMTLDNELAMLRPARYGQPAEAVYAFAAPPGCAPRRISFSVMAALFKRHPSKPSDSALDVLASPDGLHYALAGTINAAVMEPGRQGVEIVEGPFFEEIGFYHNHRLLERSFDLSRFAGPDGRLFVKMRIVPGKTEGFLNIGSMRLTAGEFAGPSPSPSWPLEWTANALIRDNNVHPWSPGAVMIGPGVFGFAGPGLPDGVNRNRLSPESALPAFAAAHPGLAPVYALRAPDGATALTLYDPGLVDPGLNLGPDSPEKEAILAQGAPFAAGSLQLSGELRSPVIDFGGTRLAIPVAAPAGSVLELNPGGQARLAFTPDFTKQGFDPSQMAMSGNVVPADDPDYDGGLTCAPGASCFFTYQFVSAYPMKTLRVRILPRLYGAKGQKRRCQASYSTDGGPFVPLAELTPETDGDWSLMFLSQYRKIVFDKPVTRLVLRFDLESDFQAQFWSPERPTDNMYVEAELDASMAPGLTLARDRIPVTLMNPQGNRFRLILDAAPIPFSSRIFPR